MIVIRNHSIALCVEESKDFKGFYPVDLIKRKNDLWELQLTKKRDLPHNKPVGRPQS